MDIYSESESDRKYAKVNLQDKTRKEYAQRIEDYMNSQQAFLQEDLTVGQLANFLDIPQHHISMAINTEFGKNFYQYVNQHRVAFAMQLLREPGTSEENIMNVAFRSGFKSKSTFNKAFKSINNMTPTQFRKQLAIN
ncbi:MAG: AraC family transcriptional regulator [Candidatus Thiodiazotropha sp. (ex Monitilora ramsayi)]|nr:AraC family transcriptional regulator [Candidatus Thiodiazotropha sp. (ex Monitilora ramsayi)]